MTSLREILGATPDGRELFRYRLPDAAYLRMRADLRQVLAHRRPASLEPEDAAIFCVFGAEWWRREHRNGPWSWHGIRRELGIDGVSYHDIISCVQSGLLTLGRPLLISDRGTTEFLVTLACEGGLPLRRLEVDGANLQTYFRAVLEHFEATGITGEEEVAKWERVARLHAARLPVSLHHDVVFRLCAELLGKAWSLRRALGAEAADPIRTLDRTLSNWRDSLPLVLSDSAAESLLRGLMADVARVAAGPSARVRFVTQIVLPAPGSREDRPHLMRSLIAPLSIEKESFAEMFGDVSDAQRVQLRVRNDRGDTLRVGMLARAGTAGWAWQPVAGAALTGATAEGQLVLEALTRQGQPLESHSVEGSGRLGPLPWVFRLVDGRTWELVGIGSTTRREPELLVALPAGAKPDGGSQQVEGELLGRKLLRVSGEVRVSSDAGVVRVQTGQLENSATAFELRGQLFRDVATAGTEVWRGLPKVKARFGSVEVAGNLEVRTATGWALARGDEVGTVDLRAMRDGEVVFQDRVMVAPQDLIVRLAEIGGGNRPGVIEVSSASLSDAGVREDTAWTLERLVRLPLVQVAVKPTGRPPARLPLRLAFGGAFLDGTVAFPCRSMRFEAADGSEIASGTAIHAKRLGGIRAVGLAPAGQGQFHVTLRAQVPGGGLVPPERTYPLTTEATGEQALELRDLQTAILAMLDATEDLDAAIGVRLWQAGGDGRGVDLMVRRYDWLLTPDKETGDVALAEHAVAEVEDVVVEARPFADIGEVQALPRLRSARYPEPRWVFGPNGRPAGSWLITARQGGWYRCRPVAFLATGPQPVAPTGLRSLVQIGTEAERMEAMRVHLVAMAADWSHPDWPLMEGYARLLGDLPASTFDLFRVLVTVPEACAALVLRAAGWAPADLVSVIDGLDELVFMWVTLPLAAWATAFASLHRALEAAAPDLALTEVNARVTALGTWVHTAPVAFHAWLKHTGREGAIEAPDEVRWSLLREAAPRLIEVRHDACRELIRQHLGEDAWPTPSTPLPAVPSQWSVVTRDEVEHRKGVLQAPVIAARAAVGKAQLDRSTLMFIESARAFDDAYFDQCFKLTFAAILASGQGVW